jgi:hypothetical protein
MTTGEGYVRLKRKALRIARQKLKADSPHLRNLELDLIEYEQKVFLQPGGGVPCPWYSGDLSWLDMEYEAMTQTYNVIELPDKIALGSFQKCHLCFLLRTITPHIPKSDGFHTKLFHQRTNYNRFSLKPTSLTFSNLLLLREDFTVRIIDEGTRPCEPPPVLLQFWIANFMFL